MSDEVRATNFGCGCCDSVGGDSNWIEWIIIIAIIYCLFCGGNNWFGGRGGCCR